MIDSNNNKQVPAANTSRLGPGEDLKMAVSGGIEWLQLMIAHTWRALQGKLAMLPFGAENGKCKT